MFFKSSFQHPLLLPKTNTWYKKLKRLSSFNYFLCVYYEAFRHNLQEIIAFRICSSILRDLISFAARMFGMCSTLFTQLRPCRRVRITICLQVQLRVGSKWKIIAAVNQPVKSEVLTLLRGIHLSESIYYWVSGRFLIFTASCISLTQFIKGE